jgi:Fe2+ or Zn2+ uptake regulation protein
MEQVTDRLRAAGLRVTAPRVSVLGVLDASQDHPRVDQVIERVRAAGVSISTQATYDVCEALHAAGLARRIAPAGGPVRYESRVADNHHHLVCRSCGATVEIEGPDVESWAQHTADAHGFTELSHTAEIFGLCRECSAT